jgi:PAS domain S-box-containing protein
MLSTVQLRDMNLPNLIRGAADSTGFSLDRVIIEVTESVLTESAEFALAVTEELKGMGCKIALDDFGTGYSSLLHLQSLPFDELKVDRSFVMSMQKRRQSRKIVSAVIGLGQSLGLATVAEGVETREQAEMLLWLGCEFAQGWFYGKAMAADQLENAVLASQKNEPLRISASWESGSPGSECATPLQRMAHLQAVYDGAPVGLGFLDCNLRYVNLNEKLAKMNGSSVEDHLGARVEDMIPEIFPSVEGYLERALAGEAISDVEAIVPASSTSREEVRSVSYQPALDEAGEVVGVSIAVLDITERKVAEEALLESEEHYRSMVELNPQVLWVMNPDGCNLDVSSRWDKEAGLLTENCSDHSWLDAVHPDDVQATVTSMANSMGREVPIDVEYRVRKRSGHWRWMRSCGSPRFDAAGKIVCWYGSVEDIDDLRRTETALRLTEAKLLALTQGSSQKEQGIEPFGRELMESGDLAVMLPIITHF